MKFHQISSDDPNFPFINPGAIPIRTFPAGATVWERWGSALLDQHQHPSSSIKELLGRLTWQSLANPLRR